jgi:hypothetical protein
MTLVFRRYDGYGRYVGYEGSEELRSLSSSLDAGLDAGPEGPAYVKAIVPRGVF